MNAFSPFAHSSQAQMTLLLPMTESTVQQPEQLRLLTSTNLVDSAAGNLFSALLAIIWVAVVFFHVGVRAGQRQAHYHDRTARQQKHIQALERIWQMSAKRND